MSEEKAKGWGKKAAYLFMVALLVLAVCFASYLSLRMLADLAAMRQTPETKTLTILHAWEEGGQYYFADELGSVYHIACKRNLWKQEGELQYDDMPKIRFEKLEVGHRYHIEYVLKECNHVEHVLKQGNVRLSLSEKEMVR